MLKKVNIAKIWKPISAVFIALTLIFSVGGGFRSMYFWVFGRPMSLVDREIIQKNPTHLKLDKVAYMYWVSDNSPDITVYLTNNSNVDAMNVNVHLVGGNKTENLKITPEMKLFDRYSHIEIKPYHNFSMPIGSVKNFADIFKSTIVQCNKTNMGDQNFNSRDICFQFGIMLSYQSPYGNNYKNLLPAYVVIPRHLLK